MGKNLKIAGSLALCLVLLFSLDVSAGGVKMLYKYSIYADSKGDGMKGPEGVACGNKPLVVIADSGKGRLLKFTSQEGSLTGGEELKVPELIYPVRVQTNTRGEIFVLDGKQRRIVRLDPEGKFLAYLAPEGYQSPMELVPRSFKIDGEDTIYILDVSAGRVLVLNAQGKYLRHLELPQEQGSFSDLALGPKGVIYLLDSVNAVVYTAERDAASFAPLTKKMNDVMSFSTNIIVDGNGIIYLADQNGGGIIAVGQDGSFQGRPVAFGWKEGMVRYPLQMCINGSGEMFIADRGNSRIQVFSVIR